MLRLLYSKVIAQHCTVLIKYQHLAKFVLHLTKLTEKYLISLCKVLPVRCMQTTKSVTLKQLLRKNTVDTLQKLEQGTNTIMSTLYQS